HGTLAPETALFKPQPARARSGVSIRTSRGQPLGLFGQGNLEIAPRPVGELRVGARRVEHEPGRRTRGGLEANPRLALEEVRDGREDLERRPSRPGADVENWAVDASNAAGYDRRGDVRDVDVVPNVRAVAVHDRLATLCERGDEGRDRPGGMLAGAVHRPEPKGDVVRMLRPQALLDRELRLGIG